MADNAKQESKRALRVFLCHATGDKPAVRELYQRLCARGIDAWLDEEKLLPGQDWQLEQKFPDSCFGAWLGGPDWRNRPEPGKFSSNYVQLASCFGTCVPNLTLLDNNRETFVRDTQSRA